MTRIILFFIFGYLTVSADEPKDICDPSSFSAAIQYRDRAPTSHEIKLSGRALKVGGVGESYPPDLDHLAVQRGLINCAPKVLKCFRKSKTSAPTEFTVSFDLQPSGEVALASNFEFISTTKINNQLKACLSEVWSKTSYGLIVKGMRKISMPVQIK